jgi:hypothetical protein
MPIQGKGQPMTLPKFISMPLLLATLILISTHTRAQQCLSNLPDSVRTTAEPDNWKILQPADLTVTNLQYFKNGHPGQCPGVAIGNFYPKGKQSYLLALIQRDDQKVLSEKLIVVFFKKDQPQTEVVVPPTPTSDPSVVWRLAPGGYASIDGSRAHISRDSFVYEQIHGAINQFYYQGKTVKSLVLSR